VLFLTDMGDKPARVGFKVWANGTVYYLGKLKLVPHETRMIDLKKLRDAQQSDLEKHTIPRDATDGSVLWIRLDNVPVMGRLAVIRRDGGVASSYDCTLCNCPGIYNYSTTIVPNSQCPVGTGSSDQLSAEVWFKPECNNTLFYNDLTDQSGWISSDGSVFTVNNSSPIGLLKALAAGSATATGTPPQQCTNYNLQGGYTCYCTSYSSAGGSGQCQVTQAVPTNFKITSVTDIGKGLYPGLQANFTWQSSDGKLPDLSNCSMRENTTYPTQNNSACPSGQGGMCYYPSSPPWPKPGQSGTGYPNPTVQPSPPAPATSGSGDVTNSVTNLNFVKPYSANSFAATEYVQYSCNGGSSWSNLYGPATITRSASQNPQKQWVATISRTDTTTTSSYVMP